MDCVTDISGNLQFTVAKPETIAGITGSISQERAALTFDDKILAFPMLADNALTPVSAPWIFMRALRGGNLTGCSNEGDQTILYIDDSYEESPLHLEICVDNEFTPKYVEMIWNDCRILSMNVLNFTIQ